MWDLRNLFKFKKTVKVSENESQMCFRGFNISEQSKEDAKSFSSLDKKKTCWKPTVKAGLINLKHSNNKHRKQTVNVCLSTSLSPKIN